MCSLVVGRGCVGRAAKYSVAVTNHCMSLSSSQKTLFLLRTPPYILLLVLSCSFSPPPCDLIRSSLNVNNHTLHQFCTAVKICIFHFLRLWSRWTAKFPPSSVTPLSSSSFPHHISITSPSCTASRKLTECRQSISQLPETTLACTFTDHLAFSMEQYNTIMIPHHNISHHTKL